MENLIEMVILNETLTEEEKRKVKEYLKNLELDILITELEKTW